MHLAIIGHTAHYKIHQEGVTGLPDEQIAVPLHQSPRTTGAMVTAQYGGWGPTVKEINWLARAFDRVTHLACLHTTAAPMSALPYDAANVALRLVPPAGGHSLREKSRVLAQAWHYFTAARALIREADVVQIRVPGPLGMYGMFALTAFPEKVGWIKYAGNWNEALHQMPPSFRIQRWWLRHRFCRQPITINGTWPEQPTHAYTFLNPSLTLQNVQEARTFAYDKQLSLPLHLIFIGRVEHAKGVPIVLQIVKQLAAHLTDQVVLHVIGGGAEQPQFEQQARDLGIHHLVHFCGWLSHTDVLQHLRASHIILLPSSASEGWPKVLSEAMNYGVVPVTSDVSAIPQVLQKFQAGIAVASTDPSAYALAIQQMVEQPERWKAFSLAGIASAIHFTYERYLLALDEMFQKEYRRSPMRQQTIANMADNVAAEMNL